MYLQEFENVGESCLGEAQQLDSTTIGQEMTDESPDREPVLHLFVRDCAKNHGVRGNLDYCDSPGHDQVGEDAEKQFEKAVDWWKAAGKEEMKRNSGNQ